MGSPWLATGSYSLRTKLRSFLNPPGLVFGSQTVPKTKQLPLVGGGTPFSTSAPVEKSICQFSDQVLQLPPAWKSIEANVGHVGIKPSVRDLCWLWTWFGTFLFGASFGTTFGTSFGTLFRTLLRTWFESLVRDGIMRWHNAGWGRHKEMV